MNITSIDEQDLFTLEEVKNYLKVTDDNEDAIILQLIDGCIDIAERATWQSLRGKTIEMIFTDEPEWVILPQPPVETIDKVERWNGSEWIEIAGFAAADPNGYVYTSTYKTLRFTYTVGIAQNKDIRNMVLDLIAAKYDSRPHDSDEVKALIKDLERYRRWVVK
jgi:hypothetical protein